MDFSGHRFCGETDLSGLILVKSDFSKAKFTGKVRFSGKTWFYHQTWFCDAIFEEGLSCWDAWFEGQALFSGARFKGSVDFVRTKFTGGASFTNTLFDGDVMFNESRFEERYFSGGLMPLYLADFTNAKFVGRTSFREVVFGNDDSAYSRRLWPERRANFTNAKFLAQTDFRDAVFGGVPAFFNATLHEDTDLSRANWEKADTENVPVDYAIRAWERLELMMSKLEKPLDRHRFFRLKMRARRRKDGWFLRMLNRWFEITTDYGWSVERAFLSWLLHWTAAACVLFASSGSAVFKIDWWKLALAALGTSFANAHAFLGLAADGGYLVKGRQMLESNATWWMLAAVGSIEAVLGPTFLFLLLLTLRNRFRLA